MRFGDCADDEFDAARMRFSSRRRFQRSELNIAAQSKTNSNPKPDRRNLS